MFIWSNLLSQTIRRDFCGRVYWGFGCLQDWVSCFQNVLLCTDFPKSCHKYSNTEKKTKLKLNSSNLGLKETWKKGRRQMWHDSWMQTIMWYSESQQAVNFNISLKDESFYESLTLFDLEEDVRGLKYSDINAYISFTIYCLCTQRQ